jgi:regulator of protease activity HflC (stomatin/prohibitin superfamily)
VIERFGKYNRTLEPDLSIVIPFMDRVAYRHRLTEFPIDMPRRSASRATTPVQVDGVLYYQITDAARASYGAIELPRRHHHACSDRTALGNAASATDKLLEDRDAINRTVDIRARRSQPELGVKVLRYEIRTSPARTSARLDAKQSPPSAKAR